MTLKNIIDIYKAVADEQPNVNMVAEGDVYRIMNERKSEEYTAVVLTQGRHTWKDGWNYFNLTIFYIDRLIADLDTNRLQIQSIGIEVLKNIIRTVAERIDGDIPTVHFQPFTEKFNSLTAGVYATIQVPINDLWLCPEEYDIEN